MNDFTENFRKFKVSKTEIILKFKNVLLSAQQQWLNQQKKAKTLKSKQKMNEKANLSKKACRCSTTSMAIRPTTKFTR